MKKNLTKLTMPIVKHNKLLLVLGGMMAFMIGLHQLLSVVYAAQAGTPAEEILISLENESLNDPFKDITFGARAVYVYSLLEERVLFAKNEDKRLPLASITKLMTALTARDYMNESTVVVLSGDDLLTEGDSGLLVDERWRLGELLQMMLLVSSNDAATAASRLVGSGGQDSIEPSIARTRFIQMMNDEAEKLGLVSLEFSNESGLDIKETENDSVLVRRAGGFGSARDVAQLASVLWKKYPDVFEITAHKDARMMSQSEITHTLINTNEITGHIPGLMASKTGYTDLAGGNLVVIFDISIGHPVVAVVLGSTQKGRFEDMEKIAKTVIELNN
jgi:D-alanyl-D-alanine carboxypeptidase (penicillin-binding protein 5/6)